MAATYEELYDSQIKGFCEFAKEYADPSALMEMTMPEVLLLVYDAGRIYEGFIETENVQELKKLVALHPKGQKALPIIEAMSEKDQQTCAKFLKWLYHFAKEFIEGA